MVAVEKQLGLGQVAAVGRVLDYELGTRAVSE